MLSPVDVNVARATLGVRPTPNTIAGAILGRLHCTGRLREPVFSGVLDFVPPTSEMIEKMEDSEAKSALLSLPGAVGAFDKVAQNM